MTYQRISGRNQLVGRVVDVRVSGLVAQVTLSVGGQLITSLDYVGCGARDAIEEGPDGGRPDQGDGSHDYPCLKQDGFLGRKKPQPKPGLI